MFTRTNQIKSNQIKSNQFLSSLVEITREFPLILLPIIHAFLIHSFLTQSSPTHIHSHSILTHSILTHSILTHSILTHSHSSFPVESFWKEGFSSSFSFPFSFAHPNQSNVPSPKTQHAPFPPIRHPIMYSIVDREILLRISHSRVWESPNTAYEGCHNRIASVQ